MAFALEQAIDEAALRHEASIRSRCANAGIPIPTGSGSTTGPRAWRSGATANRSAAQSGRYRRGVGVATGYWLYLWQPGSKVEVAVKGGRLVVSTATQDIGTGTRTVIANTVAREFGLEPHEIEVSIGDSQPAGRTGLGRQPRHGFGDPADAAGDRTAEGRDRAERKAASRSPAPTRRGAKCSRPRPISALPA